MKCLFAKLNQDIINSIFIYFLFKLRLTRSSSVSMGSVTSYDVTRGSRKRNQLNNLSSDEDEDDEFVDTEEENEPIVNAKHGQNISTTNIIASKGNRRTTQTENKLPKAKPRSIQSKMSTGSSSNVSSYKSSSPNSPNEALVKNENRISSSDVSSKSSALKSPHLTSVTQLNDVPDSSSEQTFASNKLGSELNETSSKHLQSRSKQRVQSNRNKKENSHSPNTEYLENNLTLDTGEDTRAKGGLNKNMGLANGAKKSFR